MLLDDQLMKVQAMNASPFVKAFKADTLAWAATLQALQDLLDQWTTCQASWMYLEPIFSSPDIVKQMPSEGDKFRAVDTAFRSLMEEAAEAPKCVPMAQDPERLGALREANALLEEVTRGLAAYLEKKRLFFPRCVCGGGSWYAGGGAHTQGAGGGGGRRLWVCAAGG